MALDRLVVLVEPDQEQLAEQRRRVLLPRRVHEQRNVQQLDLDRTGRLGAGRVGGLALAGVLVLAVGDLEPHDLAVAGRVGAPAVDDLADDVQAAPGRRHLGVVASMGEVRASVTELDPESGGAQEDAEAHGSAGVHQRVGDDLADRDLGRVHGIVDHDSLEGIAEKSPRLAGAGRLRRQHQVDRH